MALVCGLAGFGPAAHGDGVSPRAYYLTEIGGFPVTNSMVTSWVISIALILLIRRAVKEPKIIPDKGQAVVESAILGLREIIEPIVGKHMIKHSMPLLLGLFTFILIHNWSGLLPGVGAFGFYDEHGHLKYWFRPGNADLNMTLALAAVHFIVWAYLVLRYAGPKETGHILFGNKANKNEIPTFIYYLLFIIFFGVGIIEVISILLRLVSLSFRLFGNILGGENLITNITGLASWAVPVPFYFLELLVGLMQAFVFTLLVAVYIGLICNHETEEHAC